MSRMQCAVTFLLAIWTFPAGVRADSPRPTSVDSSVSFVVEIGNRMYPDWHETVHVRMLETFFLADTDLTARIERFVPDFRISDEGEVLSPSLELGNPAVHVFVYGDSAASDSTWAFLNFPPHFSPNSFFVFRLKEIQGYAPKGTNGVSALRKEGGDD